MDTCNKLTAVRGEGVEGAERKKGNRLARTYSLCIAHGPAAVQQCGDGQEAGVGWGGGMWDFCNSVNNFKKMMKKKQWGGGLLARQ